MKRHNTTTTTRCLRRFRGCCLLYAMEVRDIRGKPPAGAAGSGHAEPSPEDPDDEERARRIVDNIIGDGQGIECRVLAGLRCRYARLKRRRDGKRRKDIPMDDELCPQVLSAFQRQAWPDWIDDPLDDEGHPDPEERLGDVVYWLNRTCGDARLRFRCFGRRIGWCRPVR